jgi:hypothetical protein
MPSGAHHSFEVGTEYTRNEIHGELGGSKQTYLPTVAGHVVAVCVRLDLNPHAPRVVLCGNGPIIAAAGAALAAQPGSVPVFVKRATNRWEYRGLYRIIASLAGGARFDELLEGSGRDPARVSLAIELTEA